MRDALGLTSDQVYRWRLILEENGPEIIYIKGIDSTVADAISQIDFTPLTKQSEHQNWMTFTKCWCNIENDAHNHSTKQHLESMNYVFANRSDDNEIYPLTVKEIAQEQKKDQSLRQLAKEDKYKLELVENTTMPILSSKQKTKS